MEDELPSPVAPPDTIMSPPFAPEDASDPFGRDTNYDLDLADVFQDATVLPVLVTPLEVTDATVPRQRLPTIPPWSPSGRPYQRGTPLRRGVSYSCCGSPVSSKRICQPLRRLVRTPVRGSDPRDGYCDKN